MGLLLSAMGVELPSEQKKISRDSTSWLRTDVTLATVNSWLASGLPARKRGLDLILGQQVGEYWPCRAPPWGEMVPININTVLL